MLANIRIFSLGQGNMIEVVVEIIEAEAEAAWNLQVYLSPVCK